MSLKFEGHVLELMRTLEARIEELERSVAKLAKPSVEVVDEVSDWLSKRRKQKEHSEPTNY